MAADDAGQTHPFTYFFAQSAILPSVEKPSQAGGYHTTSVFAPAGHLNQSHSKTTSAGTGRNQPCAGRLFLIRRHATPDESS